jgi:hypothetical protein
MTSGIAAARHQEAPLGSWLLSLALVTTGCASAIEVPVETPLQSKLEISRFKRLVVAGFIVEGGDEIDLQSETVRLLQNHLRANSRLRVIEPDQPPLADALERLDSRRVAGLHPTKAEEEQRAADADRILEDQAFWRRIGEEYQEPLIIAGRIGFQARNRSGIESEERGLQNTPGQSYRVGARHYTERLGFTLTADFHFVDGRSGQTLHKEKVTEEVVYSEEHKVSPLSAYFELMDRVLPNVLGVIATQRVRGTRILLQ